MSDSVANQAYEKSLLAEIARLPAYAKLSADDIKTLIPTLCRVDRLVLEPGAIAEHVVLAGKVRDRFYGKLGQARYEKYLLPIRIRYEPLTAGGWRPFLSLNLEALVGSEVRLPEEAAKVVLGWVMGHVKVIGSTDVYPLGFQGDMDPGATLRGGYGTEVDISILAVAALRTVGVAARLVYSPAIAGAAGGKVWAEYRGSTGWIGWSPERPEADARTWLPEKYRLSLVICNPQREENITPAYAHDASTVWFSPKPLDVGHFAFNLMVPGSDRFRVMNGHDLYAGGLPRDFDFGIAPGMYLVAAGIRPQWISSQEILVPPNAQGWVTTWLKEGKQTFVVADQKPPEFPWKGAFRRPFDSQAW